MTSMSEERDDPAVFEAPVDRTHRAHGIVPVLVLAAALVGTAFVLSQAAPENEPIYILFFLAVLAAVGIFALFAGAIGILRFAGRPGRDDFARALLAEAENGMIVVGGEGSVLFANSAYLDLTGAEHPRDVRTVERVFASDPDVAEAIYRLAQAAREQRRLQEEFRVAKGPRGEPAWFRIRVRPLTGGSARGASVWSLEDVTRDRERQENIFQELQHAIDFLDHAPAGFFSAEPDGAITYMNATLAGWLDHDLAAIGAGTLRLEDIFSGDGASLLSTLSGTPGAVSTDVLDVDLRTRAGQTLPVRILHKVVYSADGVAGASRTLVLDRSRGEGVADPLRAAEVRFARFFNNTPIAIAAVDREGRVVRANAAFARLFGEKLKAGDGRSVLTSLEDRDRENLARALEAANNRNEVRPFDAALEGEGGRSVRFYVSAVEDADIDGEAAILYALDTSEQRALELQFAQSQKMQAIGQLAGGVAHDFNNVLTAIIGYSDLLLASHRPTDPSFQDIMQIKQNANRAAGLVRQLLAFSRRQTLRPQVLALGDVLEDLRMLLGRLLGEQVKLDVVHGRDLWSVKADLNQFEQVVVNLVVNARDAMPDGGAVTLRTRNVPAAEVASFNEPMLPAQEWILIEVQDTGSGIPAQIRDQIFEPFFSTKEVGKGTGLGLSTVYGIVKQTGGFIFVESEMGQGTTFRIFLPRHIVEEEAAPKPKAAEPARAADMTGQGTVLLVEDEDAVRSFAARALESRGYTVLAANSGAEALRVMAENDSAVDLVVSDVVMPEMDGPTLLKELRSKQPELKIIFVSGYAEDAFKKNLGDEERFVFLPKPFTLKQLIQAVKETMDS